jgi:hypothetical protein
MQKSHSAIWMGSSSEELTFQDLWPIWLSWPAMLSMGVGAITIALGIARWQRKSRRLREAKLPDISAWRMQALSPETQRLIGAVIDKCYETRRILDQARSDLPKDSRSAS